jgi:hypothetical protein
LRSATPSNLSLSLSRSLARGHSLVRVCVCVYVCRTRLSNPVLSSSSSVCCCGRYRFTTPSLAADARCGIKNTRRGENATAEMKKILSSIRCRRGPRTPVKEERLDGRRWQRDFVASPERQISRPRHQHLTVALDACASRCS